jgi:uncharacterized protein YbaP (TraB family)
MYLKLSGGSIRLLGSMHMFPEDAPELPRWVEEAYEWAEVLRFESDKAAFLPFFKSSGNTHLQTMLEPDVWATLESIWPTEGPLSPLGSINPWAALLLAPSFCLQVTEGVESRLIQWATEHSKPFKFLETSQEVVATFEAVPQEEIVAGLKLLASDLAAPQKTLCDIHTAWLAKDLKGVYTAASQSPTFSYPGLRGAVLESRNRAWAPVIERMLGTTTRTLIVVGALHLFGPNNLLELLGHSTEPVQVAG